MLELELFWNVTLGQINSELQCYVLNSNAQGIEIRNYLLNTKIGLQMYNLSLWIK